MADPRGAARRRSVRCRARRRRPDASRTIPLRTIAGLRWLTWVALGTTVAARSLDVDWLPDGRLVGGRCSAWLLLVSPPGRMPLARRGRPGDPRRGGPRHLPARRTVHLRRLVRRAARRGARAPPTSRRAPLMQALRAGRSARRWAGTSTCTPCRRSPGMLTLGDGCSVEPEVDLSGYWLDGDMLRVGCIEIGAATPGSVAAACCPAGRRSARGGDRSRIGGVRGVPAGGLWAGAPTGDARPRAARGTSGRATPDVGGGLPWSRSDGRACQSPAALVVARGGAGGRCVRAGARVPGLRAWQAWATLACSTRPAWPLLAAHSL